VTARSGQNPCLWLNHFPLSPIQMSIYDERKFHAIRFSPATSIWIVSASGQELSLTVCSYNAWHMGTPGRIGLAQERAAHSKQETSMSSVTQKCLFPLFTIQ